MLRQAPVRGGGNSRYIIVYNKAEIKCSNGRIPVNDASAGASVRDRSLEELYEEATQNELILKRYQSFELLMLSADSFEQLLQILINTSLEFFKLEAVELWLMDYQQSLGEFLPEAFQGHGRIALLSREKSFQRLYDHDPGCSPGVKLLSLRETSRLPVFKSKSLGSVAMLPLYRKGRYVGSLHFGAKSQERFAAGKSTDFMRHLASIMAVCIENALSQEHLRRLSVLDMLTRVNNRRGFHLALDREVSRAGRSGDPVSLLLVDLDHFKVINDSYGHPMGDKVLRVVAQLFQDTLRKVDHVCRYGGEEFAMVMPNCSEVLAMDIAHRLRRRVSQLRIDVEVDGAAPGDAVAITLSGGVCCWHPQGPVKSEEEARVARQLITRSDLGVYESKSSGRNAVHYVDFESL